MLVCGFLLFAVRRADGKLCVGTVSGVVGDFCKEGRALVGRGRRCLRDLDM
jgi:hypothetical protein